MAIFIASDPLEDANALAPVVPITAVSPAEPHGVMRLGDSVETDYLVLPEAGADVAPATGVAPSP